MKVTVIMLIIKCHVINKEDFALCRLIILNGFGNDSWGYEKMKI